ncbi:chitinase domain-containing protein 1-like [Babylonia areolata]|uniref:chitinase domain-containing protein 1-like n=1 Tax=Babylonia areolata TaxID=304850 RepID=UPI003FD039D1
MNLSQPVRWLLVVVCVVELLGVAIATLSKSDKGKKKKNDEMVYSVMDRGLVVEDLKKKQVTEEHDKFSPLEQGVKNFNGPVLGYVTPWNNHGYDVAKMFGAKFTHISPVWLQIKRKPGGAFVMEGGHDIDKGWVKDVSKGGKVNVVPRVLFDGWNFGDFQAVFNSEDVMEDCIDVLVGFIKEKKFPGAVIEIWSQLGGNLKSDIAHFIGHLSDAMHKAKKSITLVIPPAVQANGSPGMFVADDFRSLVDKVDFFSLMTYDYSSGGRPGPNGPLPWVRQCVEALTPTADKQHRAKILLGLNFYGTHYIVGTKVEPILGTQLVEVLKKQKPVITWDAQSAEHIFDFKTSLGHHLVYYPTLLSIYQRLNLAAKLGTGISIWEIGQGMDFFYDLF